MAEEEAAKAPPSDGANVENLIKPTGLSRNQFFKLSGRVAAATGLPLFLAACGIKPAETPRTEPTKTAEKITEVGIAELVAHPDLYKDSIISTTGYLEHIDRVFTSTPLTEGLWIAIQTDTYSFHATPDPESPSIKLVELRYSNPQAMPYHEIPPIPERPVENPYEVTGKIRMVEYKNGAKDCIIDPQSIKELEGTPESTKPTK